MAQSEKKGKSILNTLLIVMVGQVGCLTLIIILASVFGGLWLDNLFGTRPVFTLALLIAGIPVSVIIMLVVARRTLARLREQAEKEAMDTSSQEADLGTRKT
ncbi:MAG TPA: AtpZ/AtpI family protein [Anaerolineales bacterium]|nr:AtpZ/AtpI family protein [Anaerolineales bacterium]